MLKKIVGTAMSALLCVSLFTGAVPHTAAPLKASATTQEAEVATQAEDDGAYLFVHFIDEEQTVDKEQVYFSVSKNGTSWRTLNNVRPVLDAKTLGGTGGIRDPHIIRSPEGDKFYMIATDLSIYNFDKLYGGEKWGKSQSDGSQSIVIWESTDLVNWSAPRLRKVGTDNAGCVWAPESIWDKEKNAYMVFWASRTKDYWKHCIYRSYTTDFDTFTEPEVYIESDDSRIDTTFYEDDGVYYRFTKNEGGKAKYVYMEKGTSLSGDFEIVSTYTLDGQPYDVDGHLPFEGPTVYKLNGQEKWCLLLDSFNYRPFETDDISKGRFVSAQAFDFGGTLFRHGTVLPITMDEYNALIEKYEDGYDPFEEDITEGELVYALDFEDNLNAAEGSTVTAEAVGEGNLTYVDGVNGGKAVQFSKTNRAYVTVPNEALVGSQSATVSFAVNAKDTGSSWLFYAAPSNDAPAWPTEKYLGIGWGLDGDQVIRVQRFNNTGERSASTDATIPGMNEWVHVTAVFHVDSTELYINGEWRTKVSSAVSLRRLLTMYKDEAGKEPVIYLGKAMWEGGEYSTAAMDCLKIHNYAMSENAVWDLYKSDMGVTGERAAAELIYALDVNEDSLNVTTGSDSFTTTEQGTLAYETDPYGHKAVVFSQNNWIQITQTPLAGLDSFSVSFAMKAAPGPVGNDQSSWLFYLAPNGNSQVYRSEKYLGVCWKPHSNGSLEGERYYSSSNDRPAAVSTTIAQGEWTYITVVYRSGSTCLYINGELVARQASQVDLANLLVSGTVIQLGKANWDGGEYANASLSCFEIYSGALSDGEVAQRYQSYIGA